MLTHVMRKMVSTRHPSLTQLMQSPTFTFTEAALKEDPEFRRFIEVTLKIHQIFALVEVSYEKVFSNVSISARKDNIISHLR